MDMTPRILIRMMRDLNQAFPGTDITSQFDFQRKQYLIKLRLGPTTLYFMPDPKAFQEGYKTADFIEEVRNNFKYSVDGWADNEETREEQELV